MTPLHEQVSQVEREDRQSSGSLLSLAISNYPEVLSAEELERQFNEGADAFENAMWTLCGAGLLRREGDSVLPTHAALVYHRLGV